MYKTTFSVGSYSIRLLLLMKQVVIAIKFDQADGGGRGVGGEDTRSGTEKRCSHILKSGHAAWWSADNCSIFPTVNIFSLFRSKKRTGGGNQKSLKN